MRHGHHVRTSVPVGTSLPESLTDSTVGNRAIMSISKEKDDSRIIIWKNYKSLLPFRSTAFWQELDHHVHASHALRRSMQSRYSAHTRLAGFATRRRRDVTRRTQATDAKLSPVVVASIISTCSCRYMYDTRQERNMRQRQRHSNCSNAQRNGGYNGQ